MFFCVICTVFLSLGYLTVQKLNKNLSNIYLKKYVQKNVYYNFINWLNSFGKQDLCNSYVKSYVILSQLPSKIMFLLCIDVFKYLQSMNYILQSWPLNSDVFPVFTTLCIHIWLYFTCKSLCLQRYSTKARRKASFLCAVWQWFTDS